MISELAERSRQARLNQPWMTWHEARLQTIVGLNYGHLISDDEHDLMHCIIKERMKFLWTYDQKKALIETARDYIVHHRTPEQKALALEIDRRRIS